MDKHCEEETEAGIVVKEGFGAEKVFDDGASECFFGEFVDGPDGVAVMGANFADAYPVPLLGFLFEDQPTAKAELQKLGWTIWPHPRQDAMWAMADSLVKWTLGELGPQPWTWGLAVDTHPDYKGPRWTALREAYSAWDYSGPAGGDLGTDYWTRRHLGALYEMLRLQFLHPYEPGTILYEDWSNGERETYKVESLPVAGWLLIYSANPPGDASVAWYPTQKTALAAADPNARAALEAGEVADLAAEGSIGHYTFDLRRVEEIGNAQRWASALWAKTAE